MFVFNGVVPGVVGLGQIACRSPALCFRVQIGIKRRTLVSRTPWIAHVAATGLEPASVLKRLPILSGLP